MINLCKNHISYYVIIIKLQPDNKSTILKMFKKYLFKSFWLIQLLKFFLILLALQSC